MPINNQTIIVGTANQVLANTTSGTLQGGLVTLTLPQSIGTGSSPSFSTVASTVATGTAPFTVASTTPVANLSIGGTAQYSTNTLVTATNANATYPLVLAPTSTTGEQSLLMHTAVTYNPSADALQLPGTGSVSIGTLTYTPANSFFNMQNSAGTYVQAIIQNTNGGTASSADFIVNNELSTDTTYYGDFGMNSNTFIGTGALSQPSGVYLSSTTADLAIGTTTSNAIHFVINSGATDAFTIGTAGQWGIAGSNGTAGQVFTSGGASAAPSWTNISSAAVTSFSAGTTGLTPSTATTGAVTLAGTVNVGHGGTGLTTTPTNGQLLIGNGTNYTLASITGSTGLSVTPGAGTIALANTGVTSITSNTGLSTNTSATGAVTITNTGVRSIAGTANQITASAATGTVTLSLPTTITGLTSVTSTTFVGALTGNATTATSATTATNLAAGTANAIPYQTAAGATTFLAQGTGVLQEAAGAPAWTTTPILTGTNFTGIPNTALTNSSITVTGGTGLGVTGSPVALGGTVTLSNTGVTSNIAGTNISVSSATGDITIGLTGTIAATNGGTGNAVYAVGDILYANTTTTLARLADVATGSALISGGVSTAPSWGKISLTTAVSGILPIANGGTALSTTPTNGQLLIGNGTGYTLASLTGSTGLTVTPGAGSITLTNSGVVSFSAGTTGLTPNTATTGAVTLAGTLSTTNGGTGLATIGTANQILGVNTAGTSLEYKSIVAGTGISITPAAGSLTIASSGSGGGVYTFQYHARTNTQAAADPGSGNLVWNNATLTSATQLYISATDSNGVDQSVLFAFLTTSNVFYVQDADLSSTFQRWQITSITNNTGWYTLGVTLLTSANFATMSNNHNIYTGWAATTSGGVTSVGLALPSIFNVSGSPVTTTGTLTGTLATQANNLVFAGPATGGPLTPTFRALNLATNDINDVTITSATSGQALVYNGTKWVNTNTTSSASTGNVGVTPTGGGTSWSLVSGNIYTANYTHNLGTTNVVITIYNTTDNSVVVPHYCTTSSSNVVTIQVVGNTTTLKVVVIANGLSMASTSVGTVTTQLNGTTVSSTAGTLNFTGPTVNVTGASSVATINVGSRVTYYANSLDSPNTADYAINAFAPIVTDPTYTSLTVRSFSNTTEQGVSCLVSVPVSATTITIRLRGRAQTAPGAASNVQPRVYTRLLPNNSAVGAWNAGVNLTLLSVPTNANFQYYVYTGTLASVNLAAGNLYQLELTRLITGVTSNLASSFYLAEMTLEIA